MEVRDLNQPAFALQPLYTTVQTRRPATMTQPGDGENKHPQPGNKESMDSSYNMMVEREHSTKDPGEKASASPLQTEAQSLTPAKLPWYQFDGVGIAKGYNLNGLGRGPMVMSNIFLSTAIIQLAQERAGCLDEEGEVIEDCDGKAYGFSPASFVSNIAVIAGVLSALFMPLIGAMVDYTEYRRAVGAGSALVMVLIQIVQIGTVAKTWLIMAFLQAFSGFLYQAQILGSFAYLPDMSYIVGEEAMTRFTATFVMVQFTGQSAFLILIIAISYIFDTDDVVTAQIGQAVDVVVSGLFFYYSWKWLTPVPARHQLAEGHSLLTEGFTQIFRTARTINQKYKNGTRWYFLAVIFAESGANAFTTVAVVYLDEQLGFGAQEIGIFFLTTLVCSVPGSWFGSWVTVKTDPRRSWQLCLMALAIWSAGGVILLDYVPSIFSYLWGCGIGVCLGWFYPAENLFFSMCVPKGQEAELSGFNVYCAQILGWLPPLVFSVIVEADVEQTYGVIAITSFLWAAIALLACAAPWKEILIESGRLSEVAGVDVTTDIKSASMNFDAEKPESAEEVA